MTIYEEKAIIENDRFLVRLVERKDCTDLLLVYSDKNSLPFFNSDNCNGDNFYYDTIEKMEKAFDFWQYSYDNRWFARLSIVDKIKSTVIGTVELCLRISDDVFNKMCIMRVDVRSDYEEEAMLYNIINLISPYASQLVDCEGTVTKAPIYAVERIQALQNAGFIKSEHLLNGNNGITYDGYWVHY